jgi:hypothetical protein
MQAEENGYEKTGRGRGTFLDCGVAVMAQPCSSQPAAGMTLPKFDQECHGMVRFFLLMKTNPSAAHD